MLSQLRQIPSPPRRVIAARELLLNIPLWSLFITYCPPPLAAIFITPTYLKPPPTFCHSVYCAVGIFRLAVLSLSVFLLPLFLSPSLSLSLCLSLSFALSLSLSFYPPPPSLSLSVFLPPLFLSLSLSFSLSL